jgi:hypothetical protein
MKKYSHIFRSADIWLPTAAAGNLRISSAKRGCAESFSGHILGIA